MNTPYTCAHCRETYDPGASCAHEWRGYCSSYCEQAATLIQDAARATDDWTEDELEQHAQQLRQTGDPS